MGLLFRFIACCDQRFICFSLGDLKPTIASLSMDPLHSNPGFVHSHLIQQRSLETGSISRKTRTNKQTHKLINDKRTKTEQKPTA